MAPIVQMQQKGADEQGIRIQGDAPEPTEEEGSASKPIIGIIYPPPEVRNIVDKTASFVARNGPEFEARIRQNEANNSKFNFLSPTDPYHAYYRHKVKEFLEGKGQEPAAPKAPAKGTVKPTVAAVQDQFIPKDPPAPFEFIAEPPSISAYDLDVVRLTAQFVARNGRSFLTQLMQKETKNYQFDFLRPQHALFQYFTKLVEQYTKILIPPKNLMSKLKIEGENPKKILDDVKYRVEWTKHEDRIKAREKEAIEKERLAYSQIGWHDFVVVETVDFQPTEMGNFPTPVTINELGARLLQQERYEKYGDEGEKNLSDDESKRPAQQEPVAQESESEEESEEEEEPMRRREEPQAEQPQLVDMDMEESSDEEEEERPQPLPPTSGDVIIRRGYDPKQRQNVNIETSADGKWMISPLTGERVPAEKFQEHMRYGLLDPNWKEQRKRQIAEKQQDEEVFAGGTDIEHALKGLAERRTDIFGVEETAIGKKVGEEEEMPEDRVMWDGHSGSAESTQRKAAQGVTVDDQIEAIKKAQGIIMDGSKSSIGPSSTTKPAMSEPTPVPKPQPNVVQVQPHRQPVQMVQIQQVPQRQVLTPAVVVRPMINVVPPQQQVLVVQQPMAVQHVVQQPPPQMIVQQNPPQMLQQMHPQQQFAPQDEGPPSKRQRTEANLMPEGQFLARNHGPVMFRVACPTVDRSDWNLTGQMLTFTLPLTDEVSVIKAKIHEATGMPGGKQKLQLDGLFIKDSNSLAFYNMTSGSVINLQVKERGGRKK